MLKFPAFSTYINYAFNDCGAQYVSACKTGRRQAFASGSHQAAASTLKSFSGKVHKNS
jgi:hypothetical protein